MFSVNLKLETNALSTVLQSAVRVPLSNFTLDVSLSFAPGITVLFGPSGSGKTTLLNTLAGLIAPETGSISVDGRVLFDASQHVNVPARHRRAGYLFQQLGLFPHMSALDNVLYGIRQGSAAERRALALDLLTRFRVAHLANRRPARISGGERQRVALARALATSPGYLLLDEPLSALDARTKAHIIEDLELWNAEHDIPIVYVTHDRAEVFALARHVVVLEEGLVTGEGSPHKVLGAPRQLGVAQLAGFENIFEASVVAEHPELGTMTCALDSFGFTLECPLTHAALGERIRIGIRAGDILLAIVEPRGLSARNVLRGSILSCHLGDGLIIVDVECLFPGSRPVNFRVHLTAGAVRSLALAPGNLVWLIVKTHSCHLLR